MSIIYALVVLLLLGLLFGAILGFAAVYYKVESNPLVDQIDNLLPQTQCGQCGYPGCRPYAEAIANGDAINKCTPGGEATILKLAELMGVEPPASDDQPDAGKNIRTIAFVKEESCIGCTKCSQVCPVDAIVGTNRHVHTIISSECTGCGLCVDPCPTDCIVMQPIPESIKTWDWQYRAIPVVNIENS